MRLPGQRRAGMVALHQPQPQEEGIDLHVQRLNLRGLSAAGPGGDTWCSSHCWI